MTAFRHPRPSPRPARSTTSPPSPVPLTLPYPLHRQATRQAHRVARWRNRRDWTD
uniref:Uncharacterized protein n=1 Tax=Cryptococcus bacillisporus CA1280 TaxID=1296109 RepID=A0A0D0VP65_CRYGA|nr:hypothetical protein I312_02646 [Cryptococcus bacillisporus CA1280]